jgi:hypothetical protein
VSGAFGRGSSGRTTGDVGGDVVGEGSSVVPVGTVGDVDVVEVVVVDVVVVATSVVVVTAVGFVEVVWARPDGAGASTQAASVSAASPRHHSAVVFMTVLRIPAPYTKRRRR